MREHFTPCSLDERVDDVDKRAAFKSTDCARSLTRRPEGGEKLSTRHRTTSASAPIRFKRRLRRKRAKAVIVTNEQALQRNLDPGRRD